MTNKILYCFLEFCIFYEFYEYLLYCLQLCIQSANVKQNIEFDILFSSEIVMVKDILTQFKLQFFTLNR
jgi:hypothetical protein